MMDTDVLLAERKSTHGEYRDDARCAMLLLDVVASEEDLRIDRGQAPLSEIQRHSLRMIQHKVARILAGDAWCQDHWDDIAGYAKLVSDRLRRPRDEVLTTTFGPLDEQGEPTGRADDCVHPSHRHGRPGRRADDIDNIGDPYAKAGPVNGADVLGLNKKECACARTGQACMVDAGIAPKYVYCAKAEKPACGCKLPRCAIEEGSPPLLFHYCKKAERGG